MNLSHLLLEPSVDAGSSHATRISNFIKLAASLLALRRASQSCGFFSPQCDSDAALVVSGGISEIRGHLGDFSRAAAKRVFKHARASNPADCANPLILQRQRRAKIRARATKTHNFPQILKMLPR